MKEGQRESEKIRDYWDSLKQNLYSATMTMSQVWGFYDSESLKIK